MYQDELNSVYNRLQDPDYIAFSQTKRSKEISEVYEQAFAEYKENKYNPDVANEKLKDELNAVNNKLTELSQATIAQNNVMVEQGKAMLEQGKALAQLLAQAQTPIKTMKGEQK